LFTVYPFPKEVRKAVGYALYLAEIGERSPHAKIFKGIGNAKVWEIKENAPSEHIERCI
jgi:phage-related protein